METQENDENITLFVSTVCLIYNPVFKRSRFETRSPTMIGFKDYHLRLEH